MQGQHSINIYSSAFFLLSVIIGGEAYISSEAKTEELEEHWDYIQNRILSNVASSIWGKEFLFKKLLEADEQAQEALKHFEEARELLEL